MYEANINNFLALNPGIRKETHMESAKSIYPWFKDLWELVKDFDYKLIGKPYGCTPMLEAMGITNYDRPGIEHNFKEFDFKDFLICIDYNNKGSKELNSFEFNNLNLFKVKECKLDLEPNDVNNKIIIFKHSNHKILKYILN